MVTDPKNLRRNEKSEINLWKEYILKNITTHIARSKSDNDGKCERLCILNMDHGMEDSPASVPPSDFGSLESTFSNERRESQEAPDQKCPYAGCLCLYSLRWR